MHKKNSPVPSGKRLQFAIEFTHLNMVIFHSFCKRLLEDKPPSIPSETHEITIKSPLKSPMFITIETIEIFLDHPHLTSRYVHRGFGRRKRAGAKERGHLHGHWVSDNSHDYFANVGYVIARFVFHINHNGYTMLYCKNWDDSEKKKKLIIMGNNWLYNVIYSC